MRTKFTAEITPNGPQYWTCPALRELGVPHAWTGRIGGVSKGPFSSLNLAQVLASQAAAPSGPVDQPEHVATNWKRIRDALGIAPDSLQRLQQVHGDHCIAVDQVASPCPEADGAWTRRAGRWLGVQLADCAGVLLASSDGSLVAAVHAGWRGVAKRIVNRTIARLLKNASVLPDNLIAGVGPCIGVERFEIGPEVVRAWSDVGLEKAIEQRNGRLWGDLAGAVAMQLIDSGLVAERIQISDECTFEREDAFFSHRRDRGITGRQAALISPRIG
ncbi:MAG: peptidoglycan editing factor PgeF [Phycisphaeraceae bacterium]|nr:peptidoglycan editing factor PgeF [Phycisphaeraceae bacterium]